MTMFMGVSARDLKDTHWRLLRLLLGRNPVEFKAARRSNIGVNAARDLAGWGLAEVSTGEYNSNVTVWPTERGREFAREMLPDRFKEGDTHG